MFKQFTTIINTGAAIMWFTKIQHHGPAEVKEVPTPIIPTAEAMVELLNPVFKTGFKPPKAPKKNGPFANSNQKRLLCLLGLQPPPSLDRFSLRDGLPSLDLTPWLCKDSPLR
jgi:hypothetical protein